jgi:RNA polymerase sigma-70 factor (ECF subfamily)
MQDVCRLADFSGPRCTAPVQATTDEALVASIANHDKNAMRLLYARYSVKIYRFIARRTGDRSLADDIVNEVFLEVWRRAEKFEGRCQVATWLLAIARYKALGTTRRMHELPMDEKATAVADPADDPETVMDKKDYCEVIRNCVLQLSPAHREMIDLVYYHKLTMLQVSEYFRVPVGTVKTRLFYARKHMAELLQAAGINGV